MKKLLSLLLALGMMTTTVFANEISIGSPYELSYEPDKLNAKIGDTKIECITPKESYTPEISFFAAIAEEDVNEYFREAIQARVEYIDLSPISKKYSAKECEELYTNFLFTNPDLPLYAVWEQPMDDTETYVTAIRPAYIFNDEASDELYATALNKLVTGICAYAARGNTPLEKALLVYDKISNDYYYTPGEITHEHRTPFSFMKNGHGVCQGFSLLIKLVFDRLHIENYVNLCNAANHSWNYIKIGGRWYHMDVTYGASSNTPGFVDHKYFLLSDNTISQSKGLDDKGNIVATHSKKADWDIISYSIDSVDCTSAIYESGHIFNLYNVIFAKPQDKFRFALTLNLNSSSGTTTETFDFELKNLKTNGFFFSNPKNDTVYLLNANTSAKPLRIAIASYDKDGNFRGSNLTKAIAFSSRTIMPFSAQSASVSRESGDTTKFMLWDFETLSPVAESGAYIFD